MEPTNQLSADSVAKYLRVSATTVLDWAENGQIPAQRADGVWRFDLPAIQRWTEDKIKGQRQKARDQKIRLEQVLAPDGVLITDLSRKNDVLVKLIDVLADSDRVVNPPALMQEIIHREELMSTGIGFEVGVPHARVAAVTDLVMAIAVNRQGIVDYKSMDDRPVRIVCMIAGRIDQHAEYIKTLSLISERLKDILIRSRILDNMTTAEVYDAIRSDE